MTDEEKKAIEDCDFIFINLEEMLSEEGANNYRKSYKILKNLIEKQQKEIEELKEDNKHQWEERCKLTFELENSTSNDKIKAKIEEVKDGTYDAKIVLQSLLEKE